MMFCHIPYRVVGYRVVGELRTDFTHFIPPVRRISQSPAGQTARTNDAWGVDSAGLPPGAARVEDNAKRPPLPACRDAASRKPISAVSVARTDARSKQNQQSERCTTSLENCHDEIVTFFTILAKLLWV